MKKINLSFTVTAFRGTLYLSLFSALLTGTPTVQAAPASQKPVPVTVQSEYWLSIGGDVATAIKFTQAEWLKLPRTKIKAIPPHATAQSEYEGVLLTEVLKKAGIPMGDELRDKALMLYLQVDAADGYQVLFSLPEVDPAFQNQLVLVADTQDHQPLQAASGPLQLVIASEKVHARWVRMLKSITLKRAM